MYVYKRMRRVVCARACVRGYAVIILRCARDDALYLTGGFSADEWLRARAHATLAVRTKLLMD